jgi:glycosyltransferase involved in cell wall biosynthesis
MQNLPFISVIIPCRNEFQYIGKVIEDIIHQDYPNEKMEVLIIDGESDDNTQEVIKQKIVQHPSVKLLNNPRKIVPTGLNIGIKAAKGEVIVRIDAHCEYPSNYISYLVSNLFELNADNVGVAMIAHPRNESLKARAISIAISSPFGIGDSHHRIGIDKPVEIDSVPFGCYKSKTFEKIGLFDEELIRNQDDEFNARLGKSGGKIFLLPDLEIKYLARDTISKISKMFYFYGYFKPLVNKKVGSAATLRQFVPPIFILSTIVSIALSLVSLKWGCMLFLAIWIPHSFLNLLVSLKLALGNKSVLLTPILFFTFISIHCSYGVGYLRGWVRFQLLKKGVKFNDLSTNR